MSNNVFFKADPRLLDFLRHRQAGESLGLTAKRLLRWLVVLIDEGYEELRRAGFSREEINAVLQTLRQAAFTPEEPPLLWAYVAEAMGDEHPLTRKVRALSPAALFAMADLAWRVWKAGDEDAVKDVVA
ncbi:MAG: hypothetical protein RQ897_02330 [Thermoflexus sp.]|jgi:hypothetical protein|nr:hypothetical protein [Thermoflexus sp.]MDT7947167.1 hypothetical protein [Thermoflexus sp.]